GKACRWVVGQTGILAALVGEFSLEEHIVAGAYTGAVSSGETLSDGLFEVMLALIRGIDGAEPGAQGEFGERSGAVFFPGGAVNERGTFGGHDEIVPCGKIWFTA